MTDITLQLALGLIVAASVVPLIVGPISRIGRLMTVVLATAGLGFGLGYPLGLEVVAPIGEVAGHRTTALLLFALAGLTGLEVWRDWQNGRLSRKKP